MLQPVRVLHTVRKATTQDPIQQLLLPEQQSKIKQNSSLQGSQESSLSLSIRRIDDTSDTIIFCTCSQGCRSLIIWFCIDYRTLMKKKSDFLIFLTSIICTF